MFAFRQNVAIAVSALAALSMSAALMPAQASAQDASGTISFPVSMLPHGFNSKACQDFQVVLEQPAAVQPSHPAGVPNLNPVMQVIGKTTSGGIAASVKGSTVECAYSVEMLQVPSAQVTVKPTGKPRGYTPPATYQGGFNPVVRTVNGKKCRPSCKFSNVDFVFMNIGIPR